MKSKLVAFTALFECRCDITFVTFTQCIKINVFSFLVLYQFCLRHLMYYLPRQIH